VLEAAGTKWNFLKFTPGLVGGHCIGVDPYYLTFKAESYGYHPQVILAGRRINDGMGKVVAEKVVKCLIAADRPVKGAKVLILGWTFKENVPDVRNTRVIDIYRELVAYGAQPMPFDPHANASEVHHEYGVDLLPTVGQGPYDAIVLAVKHKEIAAEFTIERLRALGGAKPLAVIDVKSFFTRASLEASNLPFWQL
jgi:UDP-N-acetyl-D-galactosamine dehydrogenase